MPGKYYDSERFLNNPQDPWVLGPKPFADNNSMNLYKVNSNRLNSNLSDAEGLQKAYDSENRVYVDGNKMYVAGTEPKPYGKDWKSTKTNARNFFVDWKDNFTRIPTKTYNKASKYINAEKVLKENPQVERLIGHSAGGATVLELNNRYGKKYKTTTYGAPVFDMGYGDERITDDHLRFKGVNDVVGIADRRAIKVNKHSWNPLENHSFSTGFGDTGKEGGGGVNYQIM